MIVHEIVDHPKTIRLPTRAPMISFFIVVDFGLGIKGRNFIQFLQVNLLTGFCALVDRPLRRSVEHL
jgi:hypothetical protein